MKRTIEVDRGACLGARACIRRAPASFSLDAERKAVVAATPGDPVQALEAAVAGCPNFALRWVDAG